MKKIKIVGGLIFLLSIILALLFSYISDRNKVNIDSLSLINEQKSFTQEISKSILYLHRNRGGSSKQLDKNIEKFLKNKSHEQKSSNQNDNIVNLWDEFYLSVRKFKKEQEISTAYSTIVTDKILSDIYDKNLKLVLEFDKHINLRKKEHSDTISIY
ncbi:MAG TPA: hypothetical protein EYG98_05090, partial [Sulfurovum sp.]|nr:hypothetical protein [Sulfurovum sp.]